MLLPGLPAILEGILETMLPGGPPIEIGACFGAARVRLLRGRMPHTRLPVYVIDAPLCSAARAGRIRRVMAASGRTICSASVCCGGWPKAG